MLKDTRLAKLIALGGIAALSGGAIALADGAGDNQAFVDGEVKPAKLDQRRFKPVKLFLGVRTEGPVTGSQQNPEQELIAMSRDIKFRSKRAPVCTAGIEVPGLTTEQVRAMCPRRSYLGAGEGEVALNASTRIGDITVSVFNGPGVNQVRLHTASPTLGAAAPTVQGRIVRANQGRRYRQALLVEDAPDAGGDAFMITKFNATINRSTKVAQARCEARKFRFLRKVTYDDGSTETATTTQKCKRKRRRR